jgi:hypothetical protein
MSASAQTKIRFPLLALVLADLALLAVRLQPWPEVFNLPGKGSTAIDPAVLLGTYLLLVLWLTGRAGSNMVSAQATVTALGVLDGALVAMESWVSGLPGGAQFGSVQIILLTAATLVCGIAAFRAAQTAGSAASGLMAGIWCSMVSGLVACAVVLGQIYISGPPPDTLNAYKQFQELGIGDQATVVLVNALNGATALLLVGPLVGGVVGLLAGFFGRRRAA